MPDVPENEGAQAEDDEQPEVLPDTQVDDITQSKALPANSNVASEAVRKIIEPLKYGEGFRHGWLGDTRMGKTYANQKLIEAAISSGVIMALILDDKGPKVGYRGTYRANMTELQLYPPTSNEDPTRIVLRGHTLRTGKVCTAGEIAETVLNEFHSDRVLVSIDELRRAATPAGREWRERETPRLFTEGGGLGVSVTWTTQSPQRIPLEAFDQTETMGIFRARGRAVKYLEDSLFLDEEMVRILPSLKVGQWVLYQKSEPWDGQIYRF